MPFGTAVKKWLGHSDEGVHVVSIRSYGRKMARNPTQGIINYLTSLFPIIGWIGRYNLGWLTGDIVAGVTVGIVGVPQSMSYAVIATLPPEYGLYSSFVGVLVYCFFATSKDVNIGPVAVMSLTVAMIIRHVNDSHPDMWDGPQIAMTVALVCGAIVLALGLLRLGWLVEFIPAPAVSGFMTGSAISIASTQLPGLLGETGFDSRAAPYKVIVNTLHYLGRSKLDAAFGLPALVSLYLVRWGCQKLSQRYPRHARAFFFVSTLRNAFVIVTLTLAAFLFCRHHQDARGKYPIKILGTVPRGFQHLGAPKVDPALVKALASELPVATIILLLEHIAIAKSFGRVNGYKINPNQELIAIGVTNTIGTLFGAYPATGSFSRSALQSKSGSRSPAAGIWSAGVVLIALYALTPAFYWIPNAGLSAVIIHAVADLVASPKQVYSFWRVSPLEFFIWLVAVVVTVFSTVEDGVYASVAMSLALLLVRLARPRGHFLGKVTIHADEDSREVYVPLKPNGAVMNPNIKVAPPMPGVVIYRFEESYLYPNSSLVNDVIVEFVKSQTRRGKDISGVRAGDRPWNDPGPKNGLVNQDISKPLLHAVVLDFSAISQIDTTGVQSLLDTRDELERWADRPVEFHFSTLLSPWIRRALVAGGFGTGQPHGHIPHEIAPVVPYEERDVSDRDHEAFDLDTKMLPRVFDEEKAVGFTGSPRASRGSFASISSSGKSSTNGKDKDRATITEIEVQDSPSGSGSSSGATTPPPPPSTTASSESGRTPAKDQSFRAQQQRRLSTYGSTDIAPLVPSSTPFFHFDLAAAVRAAEIGARAREPTLGDTRARARTAVSGQ